MAFGSKSVTKTLHFHAELSQYQTSVAELVDALMGFGNRYAINDRCASVACRAEISDGRRQRLSIRNIFRKIYSKFIF